MKIKKILVTGGAGYIGSHTVVKLNEAGYETIIIDNLVNSSKENISGIEEIIGKNIKWFNIDCREEKLVNEIIANEKFTAAIHFAAYKSVNESVKNPDKYYQNNIRSLEVILNCLNKNKVKNILFSSSCTVYGIPNSLPINELSKYNKPQSPYAETKQICEDIILKNNIESVILRYFNPIGCHPSGLIGDLSNDSVTNLIPIVTEVASKKRNSLIIYGNDYKTIDGTCIRDYVDVEDLAEAHLRALEFLLINNGKHVYNIGTGRGLSVKEIIKAFEKANDIKIKVKIGKRRKGDIEKIWADCSLAKKQLKWQSRKSITESLVNAWKWENLKKEKK